MGKKTKARGPGHPQGLKRFIWSSAATGNVNDWMWGLDKEAPDGKVRGTDDVCTHGYKQGSADAMHVGGSGRSHRQQGKPGNPRHFPRGSPSSRGGSSNLGSDQSSLHLTMKRESHSTHRSACAGRGLWVKVNLPIFKHEKSKDAVTYSSWWWDVAIFHWSGLDGQYLLPYIFYSLQGFMGNLVRSSCKDATLSDILKTLDEHYGVIMTFNALSKELYSLKQGLSQNISEFRVHLLWQVQILHSEYPGRIQLEHMEEMKCDHFYEDLNPTHQQMSAHKVDGEHPASHSNLLLAAWKLIRQAEARDPLPPKMVATSGLNMMYSQMQGKQIPLHLPKLKGNYTFATWAVTIRNDEAEEISSVKQKGEGEMMPSADKDVEYQEE